MGDSPVSSGLTFCCGADNDLFAALLDNGYSYARFDSASDAIERAADGSAVMILADDYPAKTTAVDPKLFELAKEKNLRLFVEYPAEIPGMQVGEPQTTVWERTVVASDAFGEVLPKLSIVQVMDCHYVPMQAENPILVVARVAGYDNAVYGLPETTYPVFFEDGNLLVATTKLSGFITGRYAPTWAWKVIWEKILQKLVPENTPKLEWEPRVRPMYGEQGQLPEDCELESFGKLIDWYRNSRLLLSKERRKAIEPDLLAGVEGAPVPGSDEPMGDGSNGVLEGYSSGILWDGNQLQRLPIRSDCHAEVAAAFAIDWMVNRNEESRRIAENLFDYIFFHSNMHGGVRGNPKHPAFGLIAWGTVSPAWEVATYGDDDARVLLGTMLGAASLESPKWDKSMLKSLLANLRTTGPLGFRGERIDIPDLEKNGWRHYLETPREFLSPHFESYLWACYLWAYRATGYEPFLEKTKKAVRRMMETYPDGWIWGNSIEPARMILCLAWLVRVEDTPEHRSWLKRVANDLAALQQPSGAIREKLKQIEGFFASVKSNERYGTDETPLIQNDGDPATDQLYTTGFALLGLHEAAAATGDPEIKQIEDKLAEFLVRIQVKSESIPYLNGSWFRAFDYRLWDYWASSADIGWGAWSVESGWGTAWIGAVLALRAKGQSLWGITEDCRIGEHMESVQEEMAIGDGGPWVREV